MSSMRPQRPRRRKIRWKRLVLLLVVLFTIVTSLSWAAVYTYKKLSSTPAFGTKVENNKPSEPVSKYINILLLGVDDGDNENPGAPRRSDTMMLVSINPEDGKIHLVSIPRDTKVTIPGHKGSEKITHAFFYGGTELAIRTVEDLLELHIHHSVVINWQAFIKTVDMLGGVDLYVENNMHYEDPYANLVIHLTKGYQHLDGSHAGQYVRFRSDELGDIGRVQRQQRFLKALTEQTLQVGNLLKLPVVISQIDQYITTDITGFKMIKLANSLKKFKSGDLSTEMLPGNFATIGGVSYWVHNKEQTKLMVERMFLSDNTKMSGIFIP
ncbi:MAG: cell envelope-related transcriptional attenuator [Firmicutes bacterium]|nr:cell envelope-related transcriptional attenuator [Bacillota bacterium]